MKKIITLLMLIAFSLPTQTFAMRRFSLGFEWQAVSTTGTQEFSSNGLGSGWGSVNTATTSAIHGGLASFFNHPTTDAFTWFGHVFREDGATGRVYARCYFYYEVNTSTNPIEMCGFWDSVAVDRRATVVLTSGGVAQLLTDNNTQVGSDSSALSTNTWYCIQISATGANLGTEHLDASIETGECTSSPTPFATTDTTTIGDFNALYVGTPNASATYAAYWDDIAINDTQGGSIGGEQTSYPGSGKIVRLAPNGNGDSNCTSGAGDYANVAELPPSDTATAGGSDTCELDTTTSTAYFNVTDSSSAGIDSYDTISYVYVLARMREEASGTSNYFLRMKSASGGTATTTGSPDAGNTTVRTNPIGTTNFGMWFGTTTDPTTSIAWTPTGTNSIDNMQAGVGTTDGTPDTWNVTYSVFVEYVDGSPPSSASTSADSGAWFMLF